MGDIGKLDKLAIGLLSVIMIAIGIFPRVIEPIVQSGVTHILALLGGM